MTQKDSFIFYRSFFEASKPLPNNDRLALFDAITSYALDNLESELTPLAKAMFCLIKPQLDANHRRFENGNKGGRPRTETKPINNLNKTKPKPNDNVNENVNVNLNKNENVNSNENVESVFALQSEKLEPLPEKEASSDFEDFWKAYPKKENKQAAAKSFKAALKKVNLEVMAQGLERYKAHIAHNKTEAQYICNASTWLNQARWENAYEINQQTTGVKNGNYTNKGLSQDNIKQQALMLWNQQGG